MALSGESRCAAMSLATAMGFLQAFLGTACTATTVARHAQLPAQIFECPGAAQRGFMNLAVRDGLANTDVHAMTPNRA